MCLSATKEDFFTAETLDDAVAACRISLAGMPKAPVLIHIGTDAIDADDALLRQMPGMEHAVILHKPLPEAPELNICGSYAVSSLEKAEWKIRLREYLSDLLKEKPRLSVSAVISLRPIRSCTSSARNIFRF